jgi:hypothetical protein
VSTLGNRLDRLERERRMKELDRQMAEQEAREQRERAAEAQRQREARDRRDAEVRAAAYRLQQRCAEARQAAEAAADEFDSVAHAFAHGRVDEPALFAAWDARERARVVADALELGFRELRGDPALAGRR